MNTEINNNYNESEQEKIIEIAFRAGGFLFPETVEEVKEFEKNYGNTDVILPTALQYPTFLDILNLNKLNKIVEFPLENLAMAARAENKNQLPKNILDLMAEDRKQSDTKRKFKKR